MADTPSWDDLLADPLWQTPFDSELLPYLLAFGPPVDFEVRRCRCAAVHIGTCSSGDVVTPSRTDRQPPTSATQAKGGTVPDGPAHNLLSSWCLLALDDPDVPGTTAEENCEVCRPRT